MLKGKFCQFLSVVCLSHNSGGVLSFHVFMSQPAEGRVHKVLLCDVTSVCMYVRRCIYHVASQSLINV